MLATLLITLALADALEPTVRGQACLRVVRDVPAGALPIRADFAPARCEAATPAFRYDRGSGLVRAARNLQTGDVVHAPPAAMLGRLRPGDTLALHSVVGPVAIERQVVVVRDIMGGRSVLVRAADGAVFSAPAPEDRP